MQSGAPQSTNLKINSFKEKKINKKTYLPYFSLRSIFLKHVSTKINTLRVPEGGGGGMGEGGSRSIWYASYSHELGVQPQFFFPEGQMS